MRRQQVCAPDERHLVGRCVIGVMDAECRGEEPGEGSGDPVLLGAVQLVIRRSANCRAECVQDPVLQLLAVVSSTLEPEIVM